jgi:hypothetical protein
MPTSVCGAAKNRSTFLAVHHNHCEPQKTLPGFLERTQNEKRRFRFASKSKPCGFAFGWHSHVPMGTSKNQGFLEQLS